MDYLFQSWEQLKSDFKKYNVFLFLDYDGTLSPLAATPGEALLSEENKMLLKRLAQAPRCRVAVVSGRTLPDLRQRVGLKNVIYAGNHGFDIEGPGLRFKSVCPPQEKSILKKMKDLLAAYLSSIDGVLVEDKGTVISVHYRLVGVKDRPLVKKVFHHVCRSYDKEKKIEIFFGKKVMEVRPRTAWDKGVATLWLLRRQKFDGRGRVLPVYVGDDTTDEDAFGVLCDKGPTILVSPRPWASLARYYLRDTREVTEFLGEMVEFLED